MQIHPGACCDELPHHPHAYMSKHGGLKGPKNELDSEDMWHPESPIEISTPSHHCMAAWNSEGSNCRLRPGEGAVAAWGDETDNRRALSGKLKLCKHAVFQFGGMVSP